MKWTPTKIGGGTPYSSGGDSTPGTPGAEPTTPSSMEQHIRSWASQYDVTQNNEFRSTAEFSSYSGDIFDPRWRSAFADEAHWRDLQPHERALMNSFSIINAVESEQARDVSYKAMIKSNVFWEDAYKQYGSERYSHLVNEHARMTEVGLEKYVAERVQHEVDAFKAKAKALADVQVEKSLASIIQHMHQNVGQVMSQSSVEEVNDYLAAAMSIHDIVGSARQSLAQQIEEAKNNGSSGPVEMTDEDVYKLTSLFVEQGSAANLESMIEQAKAEGKLTLEWGGKTIALTAPDPTLGGKWVMDLSLLDKPVFTPEELLNVIDGIANHMDAETALMIGQAERVKRISMIADSIGSKLVSDNTSTVLGTSWDGVGVEESRVFGVIVDKLKAAGEDPTALDRLITEAKLQRREYWGGYATAPQWFTDPEGLGRLLELANPIQRAVIEESMRYYAQELTPWGSAWTEQFLPRNFIDQKMGYFNEKGDFVSCSTAAWFRRQEEQLGFSGSTSFGSLVLNLAYKKPLGPAAGVLLAGSISASYKHILQCSVYGGFDTNTSPDHVPSNWFVEYSPEVLQGVLLAVNTVPGVGSGLNKAGQQATKWEVLKEGFTPYHWIEWGFFTQASVTTKIIERNAPQQLDRSNPGWAAIAAGNSCYGLAIRTWTDKSQAPGHVMKFMTKCFSRWEGQMAKEDLKKQNSDFEQSQHLFLNLTKPPAGGSDSSSGNLQQPLESGSNSSSTSREPWMLSAIDDLIPSDAEKARWLNREATGTLAAMSPDERVSFLLTDIGRLIAGAAAMDSETGVLSSQSKTILNEFVSDIRTQLYGLVLNLERIGAGNGVPVPEGVNPADFFPVTGRIANLGQNIVDFFKALRTYDGADKNVRFEELMTAMTVGRMAATSVLNLILYARDQVIEQVDNRLSNIYSSVMAGEASGSVSGAVWRDGNGQFHYTGAGDGSVWVLGRKFTLEELKTVPQGVWAFEAVNGNPRSALTALIGWLTKTKYDDYGTDIEFDRLAQALGYTDPEDIREVLGSINLSKARDYFNLLREVANSAAAYDQFLRANRTDPNARELWHLNGFKAQPNMDSVFSRASVQGIDVDAWVNEIRQFIWRGSSDSQTAFGGLGTQFTQHDGLRHLLNLTHDAQATERYNGSDWQYKLVDVPMGATTQSCIELWRIEGSLATGDLTFVKVVLDKEGNLVDAARYNQQGELANAEGEAINIAGQLVYREYTGEAGRFDSETAERLSLHPDGGDRWGFFLHVPKSLVSSSELSQWQADPQDPNSLRKWVDVPADRHYHHPGGTSRVALRQSVLAPANALPSIHALLAEALLQQQADGSQVLTVGSDNAVVYGRGGNDSIKGDARDNELDGGYGNDAMDGQGGNDVLYGGEGKDTLNGAGDDDKLFGGGGNDALTGGDGSDRLYGEFGQDSLDGGLGDDFLNGGTDNDTLNGGIGNDHLIGEAGDDRSEGGAGNDTISGGSGNDSLNGGDDDDIIFGDIGSDTLNGGAGNDAIRGGDDNDQIVGGVGNDTIAGQAGDDSLLGGEGADLIDGGVGNDSMGGEEGDDTIRGASGNDFLAGGDGNDWLRGDAGDDVLRGEAGNDLLEGGAGNDTLIGGYGQDVFEITHWATGNDVIQDMGVGDVVRFTGMTHGDLYHPDPRSMLDPFVQVGRDVIVRFLAPWSAGNQIIIKNVSRSRLAYQVSNDGRMQLLYLPPPIVTPGGNTVPAPAPDGWQLVDSSDRQDDTLFGGGAADTLHGEEGNDTIHGDGGNDFLSGGVGHDVLHGEDGHDRIFGGDANDTIYGGEGSDTVKGGRHDDSIYGGVGSDRLEGEEGNDYLVGGDGNDQLLGNAGNDTVHAGIGNDEIWGNEESDWLWGQEGDDTLDGGNGYDVLSGGLGKDVLNGGQDHDHLDGNEDDDRLSGDEGNDTLLGGLGNDTLSGNAENDHLSGQAGQDMLHGNSGDDALSGDEGNDVLRGGDGNDVLSGGDGDDILDDAEEGGTNLVHGSDAMYGGSGKDRIYGRFGNDRLHGDAGDDTIDAGEDNDYLDGGDGNDLLIGWTGMDSLLGRDGNDSLDGGEGDDYLYGESGKDTIDGGDGRDRAYGGNEDDIVRGGAGRDTLYGGSGSDTIDGGADADLVFGDQDNDRLNGGLGDDTLQGGHGTDTLSGGDGDDELEGDEGSDILDGGDGFDTISYRSVTQAFWVNLAIARSADGDRFVNIERVVGGDYGNTIIGSAAANVIEGGAVADTLRGGDGNDTLIGGSGDDILDDAVDTNWVYGNDSMNGGDGNDRLYGRFGNDVLLGGIGNDYIDAGEDNDNVSGGFGNDTLSGWTGDDILHGGDDADTVIGGEGNDQVSGGTGHDNLYGEAGDDRMYGDAGNDTLEGWDGHDVLEGGDGVDTLWGHAGHDVLYGGNDGDGLIGGAGNDWLYGGTGDDWLYGEGDNDELRGDDGNDQLYGQAGSDLLSGGSQNDHLDGGEGDDRLYGEDDDDGLHGGDGNDSLYGGAGSDTIYGGDGEDLIAGGDGTDVLYGGAGRDTFEFHYFNDAPPPAQPGSPALSDLIKDFQAGDIIKIVGGNITWGKEELKRWRNVATGEYSYTSSNPGYGGWAQETYATNTVITMGNAATGPVYWQVTLQGYSGGLQWDSGRQAWVGV